LVYRGLNTELNGESKVSITTNLRIPQKGENIFGCRNDG